MPSHATPVHANRSESICAPIRIRRLGQLAYLPTLEAMREFTRNRDNATADEIWLLEHPPVFTQGLAGRQEHLLSPGTIPVVATERGGQITFHGPGQQIAYVLIDLKRRGLGVRDLVCRLEQALIDTLAIFRIAAQRRAGAPGVYLAEADGPGAKIASLGLKVSRGCSFHGLALNVAMDLEPFDRINPCGYPGLVVTDMRSQGAACSLSEVGESLAMALCEALTTTRSQASAIKCSGIAPISGSS